MSGMGDNQMSDRGQAILELFICIEDAYEKFKTPAARELFTPEERMQVLDALKVLLTTTGRKITQ